MNLIFKKLNFKDHSPVLVLKAPEAFQAALAEMAGLTSIHEAAEADQYGFALCFAEQSTDLKALIDQTVGLMAEEAVYWFAYPKKSSKLYKSDIHRDSEVWRHLGKHGYEPVRQVAIDADWSALRFKQVDQIKTMKRNRDMLISEEGKQRLS